MQVLLIVLLLKMWYFDDMFFLCFYHVFRDFSKSLPCFLHFFYHDFRLSLRISLFTALAHWPAYAVNRFAIYLSINYICLNYVSENKTF